MLPLFLAASALAADPAPTLSVPHERFTLDNGLEVILARDTSVPFVWVNVWYHVGSRDESPGRSGFAHLFEHLMFQGSEHANDDYFKPLQRVGAQINGTTNVDRTNYFEGVPREHLPLALWLESDRMGWLLPSLDEARLANQKEVVRNERRQRYENVPYGLVWPTLLANVFPEGHPYHIATIGKHEEIDAATLDDVKGFFQRWYLPNNAALVVCGDFDPRTARSLIAHYFDDVPAGPEPVPAPAPAQVRFDGERVVVLNDEKAAFERVYMVWPSPALYAPGDAELDLLSDALAGGKDGRLYRALVRDQQIAQDVSAYQQSMGLQSMYVVSATVAAGHTGSEVLQAIDEVLAQAREKGVSDDEAAIAKTQYELSFYGDLATIQGKADRLNGYWRAKGDPDWFAEDLARYTGATAQTISEALRTWLPPDRRLVLTVQPPARGAE